MMYWPNLASRLIILKLGNRYAFALDDIYSDKHFYTDPNVYYTVKRIARNFEQRCQDRERVFSNAVGYDENKYDSTVHYLVRDILTDDQRRAVKRVMKKKMRTNTDNFTDYEIFDDIVKTTGIYSIHSEKEVLSNDVVALMQLSATAHRLGNHIHGDRYSLNQDQTLWLFQQNQFHWEIERQKKISHLEIAKHFPKMILQDNVFQDFSENTLYHPHHDLMKIRKEFIKSSPYNSFNDKKIPDSLLQPYQVHPSGSLHPNSGIWKNPPPDHDILDEELRHIECSPNLQVSRILAWSRTHADKLSHPSIRIRITEMLFEYGRLDNAFCYQLNLVAKHEPVLIALLKYCGGSTA